MANLFTSWQARSDPTSGGSTSGLPYIQSIRQQTNCRLNVAVMNRMPLPFCVYILHSSKDHMMYIGFTTNLERHFSEHQSGSVRSIKSQGPFNLIYCEMHLNQTDAIRREKYFKTSAGKRAIKLMMSNGLLDVNHGR